MAGCDSAHDQEVREAQRQRAHEGVFDSRGGIDGTGYYSAGAHGHCARCANGPMRQIDGQLPLFGDGQDERQPGECPDEGAVVDIGGGKSYCIPWERWTNCRCVGHCVYAEYGSDDQ